MARGIVEDENGPMSFRAESIQFGQFKVQPIQNVELSSNQLCIAFRTNEQSSQDDSVFLEINPMEFSKTVYAFGDKSTTIYFRVLESHLDSIKSDVKGLSDAYDRGTPGRIPNIHCCLIIETNAFSDLERKRFEKFASYWLGCDKVTSAEMENVIARLFKTVEKTKATTNGNGNGAVTTAATWKSNIIIQYPLNVKGGFAVTVPSYTCLAETEYLDDAIIEFYMEYLRLEVLTAEQRARTHMFSVFFYSVLTARPSRGLHTKPGLTSSERRHERVAKWTKDVNIFEKDFLIVPVNSRNHWFLAVVCFPSLDAPVYMDTDEPVPEKKRRSANNADNPKPIKQPCILIFDSLGGEKSSVINVLRDYLAREYEIKMGKRRLLDEINMPGHSVSSPGQPNLCDCGLFVLQNIEQFFKDPIKNFELPIKGLKNWYDTAVAVRKRRDIAELIKRLIPSHSTGFSIEDLPQIQLPN